MIWTDCCAEYLKFQYFLFKLIIVIRSGTISRDHVLVVPRFGQHEMQPARGFAHGRGYNEVLTPSFILLWSRLDTKSGTLVKNLPKIQWDTFP